MAIKILIKRQFREGTTQQAFALIENFRQDARNRSGYIAGETWINHYDTCQITVVSTWQTVEDWIRWEESDKRVAHEEKLKDILITPAQFEIYDVVGGAD
jgi:heme-degrading monooxygenase HmoA